MPTYRPASTPLNQPLVTKTASTPNPRTHPKTLATPRSQPHKPTCLAAAAAVVCLTTSLPNNSNKWPTNNTCSNSSKASEGNIPCPLRVRCPNRKVSNLRETSKKHTRAEMKFAFFSSFRSIDDGLLAKQEYQTAAWGVHLGTGNMISERHDLP